jgi:cytochrome P450
MPSDEISARAERPERDDESMNLSTVLSKRADVEAVLNSLRFDPISKCVELASGPTAALRDGMARFSSSDRHPERRLAVIDELAKVDLDTACEVARRRTEMLFVGQPFEVVSAIAFRIPSEVLCVLLDLPRPLRKSLRICSKLFG